MSYGIALTLPVIWEGTTPTVRYTPIVDAVGRELSQLFNLFRPYLNPGSVHEALGLIDRIRDDERYKSLINVMVMTGYIEHDACPNDYYIHAFDFMRRYHFELWFGIRNDHPKAKQIDAEACLFNLGIFNLLINETLADRFGDGHEEREALVQAQFFTELGRDIDFLNIHLLSGGRLENESILFNRLD